MPMSQSTLQTELENLALDLDVNVSAVNWADALEAYASDAQALTPLLAPGVALGRAALIAYLNANDISVPGAAAAGLVGAFQAFWTGVAGGLATSFAGAIAITPPPYAVNLQPAFDTATSTPQTKAQASASLAAVLHAGLVGGTVTTPPAVVTPIT